MPNLNRAQLMGHLGADPEVRYTPNGEAACNFNMATSEKWKDKSGEKQERTEWHKVVIFGKLAEIGAKFLQRGSAVYVEGKITTRKWQDKEGRDRYTTEIIAREMQLLGGKGGGDDAAPAHGVTKEAFGDDSIPF